MGTPAKAVIGDIDRYESDQDSSRPFEDVILLPIPIPLYTALSNAAAKKGMSVADLLALSITKALEA